MHALRVKIILNMLATCSIVCNLLMLLCSLVG